MRRETDSVADIVIAARSAVRYIGNLTQQEFEDDGLCNSAVMYQMGIIGEAATRLSDEFRAGHPALPWRKMVGMRNLLIHAYHRVDLAEIWRVTTQELPDLIVALEALLPPPPEDP